MNIYAIIQARFSSSRLPGKVLLDLGGKPMLQWVVERARQARSLNGVAVATTVDPSDDALADFCAGQDIPFTRGNLHDVLDRYYQAARAHQADVIVRLTADCPLLDPQVLDATVQALLQSEADFAANRLPPPWWRSFPIGLDVEVVRFTALERAWRQADQPFQREHVLPYLYQDLDYAAHRVGLEKYGVERFVGVAHNMMFYEVYRTPAGFTLAQLQHEPDYGARRWTVDTAADLELLRQICARLPGPDFRWYDVLELLAREPELEQINANVQHKTAFDVDERRAR